MVSINYKLNIFDENNTYLDTLYNFGQNNFTKTMNNDFGQADLILETPIDYNILGGYYIQSILIRGSEEYIMYAGKVGSIETINSNIATKALKLNLQGALADWSSVHITDGLSSPDVAFSRTLGYEEFLEFILDQASSKTKNILKKGVVSGLPNGTKTWELNNDTCLQALELLLNNLDNDFYFYIGKDLSINIRRTSSSPIHYLTNGKEVTSYSKEIDYTKLVNKVYAWNGLVNYDDPNSTGTVIVNRKRSVENTSSVNQFGEKSYYGVWKTGTQGNDLERAAQRYLDKLDAPLQVCELEILSNSFYDQGYPIENIEVGDRFYLLNQSQITGLQIIVSIDYQFDKVRITTDDFIEYTNRELAKLLAANSQNTWNNDRAPQSY
jgi:hypothetical protein